MKIFKQIMSSMRLKEQNEKTTPEELLEEGEQATTLSHSLQKNNESFSKIFAKNFDYYQEQVKVGKQDGTIIYLHSMVDLTKISESIMQILANVNHERNISSIDDLMRFQKEYFSTYDFVQLNYQHEVVWYVLSGYTVLLVSGMDKGIAVNTKTSEKRAIEQSNTQTIVRGPKESFTETLTTNVSLIRRKIKNQHLKCEDFTVGKDTQTSVCMTYLDNVANDEIVDELRKRISEINISAIFDSGNLEELICDKVISPFPTLYHTDRPDKVAADIVEGKIAVIVDGSPFVLLLPIVFSDFFLVSEDYYQGFFMSSFLRILRYISFLLALLLPSFYIGLTTYHHQLIPTDLIVSIQAQREGVPFPAVVELLLMEITFEILREAGVRMPRAVGQTVSIVGALVIGQAAVEAGVVSHFLVIIVALTAMASFVSPVYTFANATRLIRFALIFLTAALGLYGTIVGFLIMVAHLANLKSFGVPYLSPMGPFIMEDQKDVFVRFPIQGMRKRPSYLLTKADYKQSSDKVASDKRDEKA